MLWRPCPFQNDFLFEHGGSITVFVLGSMYVAGVKDEARI